MLDIEELKKQMPFDPALLTRFHLVYIVKKPSSKEFKKITEKIISDEKNELKQGDIKFIKSYIEYTNKIEKNMLKNSTPVVEIFYTYHHIPWVLRVSFGQP